jgi:hypothetical protein
MNHYTRGFYYGLLNLQTYSESEGLDTWMYCDKEYMHVPQVVYNMFGTKLDYTKVYFNDEWNGVSIKIKDYASLFMTPTTQEDKHDWILGFWNAQNKNDYNNGKMQLNNKKSYDVVTNLLWDLDYPFKVSKKEPVWIMNMNSKWVRSFFTMIYV